MGVRGFPTFILVNKSGSGFKISGMSGYINYILALERTLGRSVVPQKVNLTEIDLLQRDKFLSTKEIYFILSQDKYKTISNLEELQQKGLIKKEPQKYGEFWRFID